MSIEGKNIAQVTITTKPRIGYKIAMNVLILLSFIRVISIDTAVNIMVKHMIKMDVR